MTEGRNLHTRTQRESHSGSINSLDPGTQIEMSASVAGVVPDGFWGIPYIGFINLDKHKSITDRLLEARKKNGNTPLVSWRIGTHFVVFIFDGSLIREAFTCKDFIDRPMLRVLGFYTDRNLGIAKSNGHAWQTTRRFTLHHLRDLGMGKSSLIPIIQREAVELMEDLKSLAGKPTHLPASTLLPSLNIIWQMIAHRRYDADDQELKHFLYLLEQFGSQVDRVTLIDLMPWLPSVIPSFFLKKLVNEDLLEKFGKAITDMLIKVVEEHKEKLDYDHPKDFIDEFLIEMERQKGDPDTFFTIENLVVSIGDLFRAGSDTTTITFKWIIYYLTKYPEIQKCLHKEIDEVLPKGTLATNEDKQRMPYTEAVIHEAMRHSSFIKFGVMHMATHDTKFGGYEIPKGAIICPSIFWVNYDPKYWDSPTEFRPERFLDSNGKFFQPKEGFYPFGIGKRQCVGESLARMALFLFVTTVVQNLEFSEPAGKKIDLTPMPISFANVPKNDQDILITVR